MRIERIPDFISEEERGTLLQWMKEQQEPGGYLVNGMERVDGKQFDVSFRQTTRRYKGDVEYPKLAHDISQRIKDSFSFTPKSVMEAVGGGPGMICVVTHPGGDTYKHIDPVIHPMGRHGIRFNIVLQNSEAGGILTVGDKMFLPKERELHCYAATKHPHSVSTVTGESSRYIWIFGFSCPIEDWEEGVIHYLR